MDEQKMKAIAGAFYGKHPDALPKKKAKKEPEFTGKVFTRTGGRIFRY